MGGGIFLKPIFWNSNGYLKPSGAKATGGYPKDFGFGHEEWNNSPKLTFEYEGRVLHAFHTERIPSAGERDNIVFMYSSYNKAQYLVGIAARANYLGADHHLAERKSITRRLGVKDFWGDAWEQNRVRGAHPKSMSEFRKWWAKEADWTPNWISPASHFLWLAEPIVLNPLPVTGKTSLQRRFHSHTKITAAQAHQLLLSIPSKFRAGKWKSIVEAVNSPIGELGDDILEIESQTEASPTARKRLVDARIGQGRFRESLEQRWNNACAVTGCTTRAFLRASHIKRWSESSDRERLDENNGLLLSAHIDALFEVGLVSFADNGNMLVSGNLPKLERQILKLPRKLLKHPTTEERKYLAQHRDRWGL